jgi:predicted nucleotidyltransferase
MNRDAILRTLSAHREDLVRRFGVRSLAVFGSVARGEARADSDVDVLVAFAASPGFDGYMALKWHLEELLGHRVDLVMEGALRPEARPIVEAEAVRVA